MATTTLIPTLTSRALFAGFAFLIAVSAQAAGENRFDGVEIKTTSVTEQVYMLEGSGGNIGVLSGADGLLMIDDQYAPLSDKIKAALAELGSDKPAYLINTHYHGDHTGGNINFGEHSQIVAHHNVRARLLAGSEADSPSLPVITYTDEVHIHFNGEVARLLHLPGGHTDGDTVVYFDNSNVVHLGDHFFNGMFPYIDIDSGGSLKGMIANISSTLEAIDDDTRIIPGHGPLANKGDLESYLNMLEQTRDFVAASIAGGANLDDLLAAGLPETWSGWGWAFITEDRWIRTLHRSLTQ